MRTPRFEVYRSWGQYRFRIVAGNGEKVAQGEGYHNRADRDSTVNLLNVGRWPVVEVKR